MLHKHFEQEPQALFDGTSVIGAGVGAGPGAGVGVGVVVGAGVGVVPGVGAGVRAGVGAGEGDGVGSGGGWSVVAGVGALVGTDVDGTSLQNGSGHEPEMAACKQKASYSA